MSGDLRASICRMNLELELLEPERLTDEWVTRPFAPDSRFNPSWWTGDAKGPLAFCAFSALPVGEVARAQVKLASDVGAAYPTYARPRLGSTEVDLFEVRPDLRGTGIGRTAVDLLLLTFEHPLVALSLNRRSDEFWRKIGWVAHHHVDAANYDPADRRTDLFFVQPH